MPNPSKLENEFDLKVEALLTKLINLMQQSPKKENWLKKIFNKTETNELKIADFLITCAHLQFLKELKNASDDEFNKALEINFPQTINPDLIQLTGWLILQTSLNTVSNKQNTQPNNGQLAGLNQIISRLDKLMSEKLKKPYLTEANLEENATFVNLCKDQLTITLDHLLTTKITTDLLSQNNGFITNEIYKYLSNPKDLVNLSQVNHGFYHLYKDSVTIHAIKTTNAKKIENLLTINGDFTKNKALLFGCAVNPQVSETLIDTLLTSCSITKYDSMAFAFKHPNKNIMLRSLYHYPKLLKSKMKMDGSFIGKDCLCMIAVDLDSQASPIDGLKSTVEECLKYSTHIAILLLTVANPQFYSLPEALAVYLNDKNCPYELLQKCSPANNLTPGIVNKRH